MLKFVGALFFSFESPERMLASLSVPMPKVITVLLFVILQTFAFGQTTNPKVTAADSINLAITGTVSDAETKQPLAFCSITILHSTSGTNTDEKGNFNLTIPKNIPSPKLIVACVNYKTDTVEIIPSQTHYPIFLKSMQGVMKEAVITEVNGEEIPRENPMAVETVSQKAIDQTTESNLIDALAKNVPGLNAVKTGPNVSKPFIHGLGYSRIETLYDGVPMEGQQFEDEEVLEVDMYNVERAQVILGPTTLMFGPDALAGIVCLYPSLPMDSDKIIHGRLFSEYQSNNGLVGNGLRLNYGNGHWSFVARGSYRMAKNYSNRIDGKVYDTGFRETNASASIVHKTENGYSDLNFTLYDDLQGIPDGSRDSLTRKFTKAIYEDPFDDIKSRPVVSDGELNSYKMGPIYQHIEHYRIYSNNHYEFSNRSGIDAMVSLQQNVRSEYDYPIHRDQVGVSMRLNSLNYDLRYHLPDTSAVETSFGINGMYQTNTNVNATDIPIPDYGLFDAGAFVFEKLKLDRLTLSGGYRYDVSVVNGNDFYTREDTVTGIVQHVNPPDTTGAKLLFPAFTKTFRGMSLDLGVTFKMNGHINIKANISRGSGLPSVSEFASNGLDASAHAYFIGDKYIRPETSWQEDVGMNVNYKTIDASATVFNNNLDDYTYLIRLADTNGNPLEIVPGNKTYKYEQGDAQLYGLESTLNFHPAYMKGFRFVNYFSLVYGFNRDRAYRDKGVNGEYLPLIPPMKLLSAIVQDIELKSKIISLITLRAEADINAAQNHYLALNETETATPGYILFNAAIDFKFTRSKKSAIQFQVQVNNIFNAAYQSNLSRLKYFEYYSQSPNGHYGIDGMGRNICIKLIMPF